MILPKWHQQKNAGVDKITGFAYTQTQRELQTVLKKVEREIFISTVAGLKIRIVMRATY